jgi:hypothetical protein
MKEGLLKRFLFSLPANYDKKKDSNILSILKKFISVCIHLRSSPEKELELQGLLKEENGYQFLYQCFTTYSEVIHKQCLALILGCFHASITLPRVYEDVFITIMEIVMLHLKGKKLDSCINLNNCLTTLLGLTVDKESQKYFYASKNFLPLVDAIKKTIDWERVYALKILKNLLNFNIMELNRNMVNALNVIIPIFNQLIKSSSSYLFPKGPNYYCLENILVSFVKLTFSGTFSTQFIDEILKKDVFLKIISLFEKHVEKLKSRELGICSSILYDSMGLILNISIEGLLGRNINTRSSLFNNKTEEILISMYNFLRMRIISLSITQSVPLDTNEKLVFKMIPIILVNLYKGKECPSFLTKCLVSVHKMKFEPKCDSDIDWSQ